MLVSLWCTSEWIKGPFVGVGVDISVLCSSCVVRIQFVEGYGDAMVILWLGL